MPFSRRALALGIITAATLAVGSVAATPATAAILPACTVTVTAPNTIAVAADWQQFSVGIAKHADGQTPGCVDSFTLSLVRLSDQRPLERWRISSADMDYQNGNVVLEVPVYPSYAIAGKYELRVTDSSLSHGWAQANGADAWNDYPTFTFTNAAVDVRFAVSASLKASRTLQGAAFTGATTRFNPQHCGGGYSCGWVAQPGTVVALQKKVGSTWVTKKSVKTNAKGVFSTVIADAAKGTWRAQAQASAVSWADDSSARTVAKKTSGKAPTKVSNVTKSSTSWGRKVSTTFTGKVTVNAGGGYVAAPKHTIVKVQKRVGKAWKSVKTLKTNAASTVAFTTKSKGAYRFAVPTTSKVKTGYSAARNW